MKKFLTFLGACAFFFTAAIIISCEGPAGPAGEVGPEGPIGLQGEQGIQGQDGTATCAVCHDDSQVNFAKTIQWEASIHATGGNFERNDSYCAPCHTSQGFLEALGAGEFAQMTPGNGSTSGTISDPNPQNCYTCHAIHSTYSVDDWDRTKTTATKGWHSVDGTTMTEVDLGEGNMCTGCHQGRALSVTLNMTDNTTTITPSSYRWGIHHGPQYNVYVGEGLYEFAGSTAYPTETNHMIEKTTDGCVDCHMNDAYGTQAGGHTFNVGYEYHGSVVPNFPASCKGCHIDDGAYDIVDKMTDVQEDIEALIMQLDTELQNAGVSDGEYLHHVSSTNITPQTHMMLAAFTNWQALFEDRSKGMHNPEYVEAVLLNTLEIAFGWTPGK